jgi:hypothetical protein
VPQEAEALARQFLLRTELVAIGIRRLAFRGETYLVEYGDRIALQRALAGASVELRPLKAGRAHLVIPAAHRTPALALAWLHALLKGRGQPNKMTSRERR